MTNKNRNRYARVPRKGHEGTQKKERGLDTLEGVIFDVSSDGARPGGDFKRYIEALAEYVGTTFKHDAHVAAKALRSREKPDFPKAPDLKEGASFQKQQEWKEEYNTYKKQERNWEENNPAIYNLLTSYCTLAMKNRLEGMDGYEEVKEEQDGIALRGMLQQVMQQRDGQQNKMIQVVALDKKLFTLWQGQDQSLESYLSAHVGLVDAIKANGGHPGLSHAAAKVVADEMGLDYHEIPTEKQNEIAKIAAQRYLSALFFSGLNGKRFKELKRTVHNDDARGIDSLPKTYAKVIKMAEEFREEKKLMARDVNESPGVAMVQPGGTVGGGRGGQDRDGGQAATGGGE